MKKIALISVLFLFGFDVSAQKAGSAQAVVVEATPVKYYRTELYMGMSIPGGGAVRSEDWEKFLSDIVTPLFPDGFTVLDGRGQYRERSGKIAKECSHVLVLLYRPNQRESARVKVERIRAEYKKQFRQESVLRIDITKSVLVSF